MNSPKRIFITGIEGVLGSALATRLRGEGHEVRGCSLTHSADPNVVRADIRNPRQLAFVLDKSTLQFNTSIFSYSIGFDYLFHFAAEFGRKNGQAYYEDLWSSNCIGTRNVIEECIGRGIKMVFASSSEAYGLSEDYNGDNPIKESVLDRHVPQFHNEYALSKYTNERQVFTASRNNGLQAMILRYFNIYGPPEKFSPYRSVACQFAWQLLNDLPLTVNMEGKRSHLWIGDWARTVAGIVDRPGLFERDGHVWHGAAGTPNVPVFNIGGEEYETIADLYNRLRNLIPESKSVVDYIPTERANTAAKQPDNSEARYWLEHKPLMDLQTGLRLTVEYLRRQM